MRRDETPHAGFPAETNISGVGFEYPHRIRQDTNSYITGLEKRGENRYNRSWYSNAVVWVLLTPPQERGVFAAPHALPLFAS